MESGLKIGMRKLGVVDNRCTDNFPSIVESIPTQGSFTLGARSLGKTRPNNIEREILMRIEWVERVHLIVVMYK